MLHIFIEYKLKEGAVDRWIALRTDLMRGLEREGATRIQMYLGYDQPNLAVEAFDVPGPDAYERIKLRRQQPAEAPDTSLRELAEGTIHVWAFRPCGQGGETDE